MRYVQWNYTADSDSVVVVIPDGCRDILIVEKLCSEPEIHLTDWDDRARSVKLKMGQKISGFRLRPGLFLDPGIHDGLEANVVEVRNIIDSEADRNSHVSELVEALSDSNTSLQSVARQVGVSVRTLQRRHRNLGLPKPEYWRMLSRARLAAIALSRAWPLAEIAYTSGYSDQSHMTREFLRWFAVTPAQFRCNSQLMAEVHQPGLGNWTFEQISMR